MSAAGAPIQSSEPAPAAAGAGTPSVPPPHSPPPPGSAPHRVVAPAGESLDARLLARREDAAWFKALQPAEQAAFRKRWQHEEDVATGRVVFRKRSLSKSALRGAVVFLIGGAMFVTGIVALVCAVATGALLGLLWAWFDLGPIRAAVLSGPMFSAIVIASRPDGLGLILSMFGFLIVASLSYAACLSRDFARTDGRE